ncbi:hypothetical protein GCM10008942_21940 [Rhizomicrobium electricum]|uniref:DUF559 domain-containing protein n=1 Tax=Rhizomicrobium electricum TaxID=480070 RepID=A0ABN1ESL8_9PROT
MRDAVPKTIPRARALRHRLTDAERILWSRLRCHDFGGLHFRKQHPLGPYIADFVCLKAKLVVEVDGATHSTDDERAGGEMRFSKAAAGGFCGCRTTTYTRICTGCST